ncbi:MULTISPECIES: universal stress protein [unclassified Streptomyces]|uniref:universal stress protein n=1 Tax=unclassified Streptomyces TaxID=2593676 RepID=UPI002E2E1B92|nr:universal stress protein [Streptomyces sp. NBC_01423]WSX94633.1 universal stress protein [Streptomyces sp. NBC_00891]WSY09113.1 universal stress protein [Streptomyces sp. NBC_00890]WSZ10734.1 universal stress protein [Streptomyces sp. NBC_00869]WSZ21762.1 universal stress protein [Streptomyces sp. NBC_00870]
MDGTTEHREIVVGVDPARDWNMALAWAVDEAHRRRAPLRLVVAVPPRHDTQHVDDTPRHTAMVLAGEEALGRAAVRAEARRPGVEIATAVLDGFPARVIGGLSHGAGMIVLGSRHLRRVEEFFSAGALVVPVTAQARCPVVVVGDAEHSTQDPPYVVVGVDGSEASRAAVALAFEEAALHHCDLRAIAVWQPPVFSLHTGETMFQAERRQLSEVTAGWAEKYPDVRVTHEITVGSPVETLAKAAEHALAVVVGRRGRGGYTGMRVGSVVRGLLHRAHCPVITVPAS